MTSPRREIDKRVTRAILEYGLIDENDRVLVALSGGKDSLALAWNLAAKSRGFPISFTVEALHLVTGFADPMQPRILVDLLSDWGMTLNILDHSAVHEAAAGNPPSCYGCARERRRQLLEYAAREGFNKVALGHHLDDSLRTLLMNMSWNGELAAMPPLLRGAHREDPSIIRPLILLQESVVARLVHTEGWPVESCRCPWAGETRRREAEATLGVLTGGSARRKLNIWKALSRVKTDLLPPQEK